MGLCPSFGLWPKIGHSPNRGHSPFGVLLVRPAGRSPASHPAAEPEREYKDLIAEPRSGSRAGSGEQELSRRPTSGGEAAQRYLIDSYNCFAISASMPLSAWYCAIAAVLSLIATYASARLK